MIEDGLLFPFQTIQEKVDNDQTFPIQTIQCRLKFNHNYSGVSGNVTSPSLLLGLSFHCFTTGTGIC